MKFKCSKCGFIFEGPAEKCPHCGATFKKPAAAPANEVKPAVMKEEPKIEVPVANKEIPEEESKSYFDGFLIQLIGWKLLTGLVTIITLGIAFPWSYCKMHLWYCKHSVYDGYRLVFDGRALQIFGKWICWILLSIITIGIYAFFIPMRLERWKAKHTHLVPDVKQQPKPENK